MKLREINKKEFSDFCKNNPNSSLFQTKEWAEFKRADGWHTYFLGLDQNGKIRACTMILSREIPFIKRRIFYAPRGLVINYKDLELLRLFTKYLKDFIKERKGIFLRIDPYLSLKELDNNGNYIQGGYNNDKCIDILRSLGYIQLGSNLTKPNKLYSLKLEGKNNEEILSNMSDDIKNTICINEHKSIYTREINDDEIDKVVDIVNSNKCTANFIDGDIKEFYQIFKKNKMVSIKFVEMDIDAYLLNASDEKEKQEASDFQYKYGHKVILGCSISVCYLKEITTLCTVIIDRFKDLLPLYTLSYENIKWAKKNSYETYNFYGITNNLENDVLYNYYKGFNGNVIELLGEFDLVVNTFLYKIYYKYSKKHNKKITDFKKNKLN